ncbi:Polysaccharide biosynthesis protein [Candidatus Electrothrix laxa]
MNTVKSVRLNASANMLGIAYSSFISIIILPFYLEYLGAEAFGLVGFFIMLQAWMQLLDMGMSPMLSRQTSSVRGESGGKPDAFVELKKILRSLELIIFSLSLSIILGIACTSSWVAKNWLTVVSLDLNSVSFSIVLMGIISGITFFSSLYKSGIRGMEEQVKLNITTVIFISLKFIGSFLLLRFVTQDIVSFFLYQFSIVLLEAITLCFIFYHCMPATERIGINFFWSSLKPLLPFAGGVAYTAGIWVLLTQMDKLILSKVLPLSEYGYFALVVTVATGITQISTPISQAILPRMTYLLSQGREQDMLILYRRATQYMAILTFPVAGMIAFFARDVLFVWTGNQAAAEWAGPILTWFALGNGILTMSAFQYYLQFAHGDLKMHVIYYTISASIQIPLIIYIAFNFGAIGVAMVWCILRAVSFILWTPIVHRKFAPGIHRHWILKDIFPVFFSTAIVLFLFYGLNFDFEGMSRVRLLVFFAGIGSSLLVINTLVSDAGRNFLFAALKK